MTVTATSDPSGEICGSDSMRTACMSSGRSGSASGATALPYVLEVLVEHRPQLGRLAIVVAGVGPRRPGVEDVVGHVGDGVGDRNPEHGVGMRRHVAQAALDHGANDGAGVGDRDPTADPIWS